MSIAPQRLMRLAPTTLLAAWTVAQSGCCQTCYVPAQPGCPPVAAQSEAVRYGEVCEAPSIGSSAVGPPKAATMADAPRPRVVVSEPTGRLAGRSGWHRSDPENIATRVEGSIDDDTINR